MHGLRAEVALQAGDAAEADRLASLAEGQLTFDPYHCATAVLVRAWAARLVGDEDAAAAHVARVEALTAGLWPTAEPRVRLAAFVGRQG